MPQAPSKAALQVAFDRGGGQRCISHRHENPYSETSEPELYAEWERGWLKTDAETANPQEFLAGSADAHD